MHRVEQGDTLSSIAARHGFHDFRTVFDHGDNAELKARRDNAHVLLPGDEVAVPDFDPRVELVPTTARHTFVLQRQGLHLRLRLRDLDNVALKAPTPVLLATNSPEDAAATTPDGNGIVEREIDRRLEKAELRVEPKNIKMDLIVGGLDPVGTLSGQRARLNNLGYFAGAASDDTEQFRWAAEEFKKDHGVKPLAVKEADIDPVNGIAVGPFTAALEKAHEK